VVVIRPLSEANQEGFLSFMAAKAFETNPNWAGCFCQFYLDSAADIEGVELTSERNRQKACDRIASGAMRGYLAFDGDEVVGWVAANKANNFTQLPPTAEETARILCFVIEPEHQGQGVATALLNFAIEDLSSQGFKTIEAAPRLDAGFNSSGYRGKLSMFLKAGFVAGEQLDEQHVLVHRELTE
jgi:ribosomal protein S18 acetylase RimI-like enzyme